jgi:hypothetical protein
MNNIIQIIHYNSYQNSMKYNKRGTNMCDVKKGIHYLSPYLTKENRMCNCS